jgi:myo-inositol-1-phosphate synthase
MGKVRVAIIGVGNCASSFVQGLHYYRNARESDFVPGLMHVVLGGYHVRDIEIVAAIDIDKNKVGKDLAEAIFTWPNNTYAFAKVPRSGVAVQRGMTHDGLGKYLSKIIQKAPGSTVDIVRLLRDTGADVVVNYLPVGSEEATKWYVEQVLEAGCGFVNCIPVFIAREAYWRQRFERKRLPVIGDDIKSQVGATITHRVLARLFADRGVRIDRTYQLNFGGNTDFLNMLERERLESKKISKTSAVTSIIPYALPEEDIHVGPSDYVPWLKDRKWCHIRMEGTTFGDVPLNLELKLEVWDSPNSAGVVIDAVRCCKLGLDHSLSGALVGPSAYFKKSPPLQVPDEIARAMTEEFIGDPRAAHRRHALAQGTVAAGDGRGAGRTGKRGVARARAPSANGAAGRRRRSPARRRRSRSR